MKRGNNACAALFRGALAKHAIAAHQQRMHKACLQLVAETLLMRVCAAATRYAIVYQGAWEVTRRTMAAKDVELLSRP